MSFTALTDKSAGDAVSLTLWESIEEALNLGVVRPLGESILESSAGSIAFSGIPGDFAALMLMMQFQGTDSLTHLLARFNSDSGSNYDWHGMYASSSTLASASAYAQTSTYIAQAIGPSSAPSGANFLQVCAVIHDYAATTHDKAVTIHAGGTYGSGGAFLPAELFCGYWRSTAAVTAMSLFMSTGSLQAGTRATLYGMGAL